MKKILAITTLGMAATGAFAQGTLVFNNKVGGLVTHVYGVQPGNVAVTGQASNDTPAGTTVYSGAAIGGTNIDSGVNGYNGNGAHFTATLWALAGTGQSSDNLVQLTQYNTTFRTTGLGNVSGFVIAPSGTDNTGIANTSANGNSATVQMRVWDNMNGQVTDWNTALNSSAHGASAAFNMTGLYNGDPASGGTPQNLTGLTSFSLVAVPEPSTIALGVMGASAFLFRRRNKK